MKKYFIPELLAPAGGREQLEAALYFGADAVYLGGKAFSLRAGAENFSDAELVRAIADTHAAGKKVYVAANIFPKNSDFGALGEYLKLLEAAAPDGVIVSDFGLADLILNRHSKLKVHISTQANTTNQYSAAVYARMGVARIILARELSIPEIAEIKQHVGGAAEIEVFVHGAMCVSYSGRCLLSNYLTDLDSRKSGQGSVGGTGGAIRDANRGECVQACRWEYRIIETGRYASAAGQKTVGDGGDTAGDTLTICEDERGTYILNSRDLNLLNHLGALIEAGVDSLKIEGRAKTAFYVATIVNAYRRALDGYDGSGASYMPDPELYRETHRASHRLYTTGFAVSGTNMQCLETSLPGQSYDFCARVIPPVSPTHFGSAPAGVETTSAGNASDTAWVEMRNRFKKR
ncbi:MAG: U32 family peptidase, partial [Firmicutes bacterium]|nr:U32 family peptidase [Bacillota bacterium]